VRGNALEDVRLQKLVQVTKDEVALLTKEHGKDFEDTQKQSKTNIGKEMGSFQR
jgi:hypothetical protein